jgi:putative ABC transport system permease protein
MKFRDSVELAGRNLRESKLRNSLTTLGITVGVASLVAWLSLGIGLQQLFSRKLTNSGLFNSVWVFPQREEFGPGNRREQNAPPPPAEQRKIIDESTLAELAKLPRVVEAYPDLRFAAEVRLQQSRQTDPKTGQPRKTGRTTQVRGLPLSASDTDAVKEMQGHFFSSNDAEEIVLRSNVAKQLAEKPESLIGQRITLRYPERHRLENPDQTDAADAGMVGWGFAVLPRERTLTVVGIVEKEPLALGNVGGAFLPLGLTRNLHPARPGEFRDSISARNDGGETYNSIVLHVQKPNDVQPTEDAVKKMGLGSFSILDASRSLRMAFGILDMFLFVFGSLALAVASIGVVNTLVMAILERRREIGIMKALGASDGDVRGLFFSEAGVMGLLGGIFGVLIGWGVGRLLNLATNLWLRRQDIPTEDFLSVSPLLVLGAIGFAILITLVAGLYPAGRAAKLDPVQALRYE